MTGRTRSLTKARTVSRTRRSSSLSRSSTANRSSAWNGRVIPASSLSALQEHGDPLTAADAKRGQPAAGSAPEHLVNQGDGDACARGADRVAEGDGAPVYVEAGRVEAELLLAGDDLG